MRVLRDGVVSARTMPGIGSAPVCMAWSTNQSRYWSSMRSGRAATSTFSRYQTACHGKAASSISVWTTIILPANRPDWLEPEPCRAHDGPDHVRPLRVDRLAAHGELVPHAGSRGATWWR